MNKNITEYNNFFFIGVGGTGMSAIAQYLSGIGKNVSGSDRIFNENNTKIQQQLENEEIKCFPQDCSGLNENTEVVIVSTAIEKTVPEYQKAIEIGALIVHRSEILKAISETKRTIAISGTSGKSTTVAMLFQILQFAEYSPSMLSGAGLISLQKIGKIGNSCVGKSDWLIIEADESDGTLAKYSPEIGVILNIDKDHKEFDELNEIFTTFSKNIKSKIIVNHNCKRGKLFSKDEKFDFNSEKGFYAEDFKQQSFKIFFKVKNVDFEINTPGIHNMENALAAISVANFIGIPLEKSAEALKNYEGIYRRMQKIGEKNQVIVVDDYAHNPAKISAAIKSCQLISNKVIAWFQPHGFTPTRFLKNDFIEEISKTLRENDEIWMSEIFYAGGTVNKDISANDLIEGISKNNKKAFFVENRKNFPKKVKNNLSEGSVLLLMGARDNSLEGFAKYVFDTI